MSFKLSVITVTYNSEATIESFLKSLLPHLPKNAEVLIVDNDSQDKTIEKIKKYPHIQLIEQEQNLGFGKANNIAVKKAQGEYLLFLNPDTKVTKEGITQLISFYEHHKDSGIVAPKLLEDNQTQFSVRKLPTILGAVKEYYFKDKGAYEAYAPKGKDIIDVESVVGAAMLIKKSVFEKVGGFDERYFMYYEDLALCKAIRLQGLKIYYLPEVTFYHKVGASFSEKKGQWIQKSAQIYHGYLGWLLLYLVLRLRPKRK